MDRFVGRYEDMYEGMYVGEWVHACVGWGYGNINMFSFSSKLAPADYGDAPRHRSDSLLAGDARWAFIMDVISGFIAVL